MAYIKIEKIFHGGNNTSFPLRIRFALMKPKDSCYKDIATCSLEFAIYSSKSIFINRWDKRGRQETENYIFSTINSFMNLDCDEKIGEKRIKTVAKRAVKQLDLYYDHCILSKTNNQYKDTMRVLYNE